MTETRQAENAPDQPTPAETETETAVTSAGTATADEAKAEIPARDDEESAGAAGADSTTGSQLGWSRHRRKFLAGAAGLVAAAVAGTLITLALPEKQPQPSAPDTVAVTYRVTGEGKATISYNTGRADAPGAREQLVDLPWEKKARVNPESGLARVSIVLDEDGGRAQCALSVAGEHRRRATAFGDFGRATCSAKVPGEGTSTR